MSNKVVEHYEAALKEAFPRGATGDVFHHWNEARKLLLEQQPADEPVVFNTLSSLRHKKTVGPIESAMTGRPQSAREWVGLTDEEVLSSHRSQTKEEEHMSDYDKSIHSNPDAQAWAKFFMATVKEKEWCIDDIDEGLMLGWFANAMMAMYDHTIAVNKLIDFTWVGYTAAERDEIVPMLVQSLINHDEKTMTVLLRAILMDVEEQLKAKNGYGDIPGLEVCAQPTDFISPSVVKAISKREWVGLTDEEIQTIVNKVATGTYQTSDTFARAIEQALKEKNT